MRWRIYAGVFVLTVVTCELAQGAPVTIENPKNLPVKEQEVTLLYTMVCQQVADNFQVRDYKKLEYSLTVVLGEDQEGYSVDHAKGTATIHLQKWDEARFASTAVMIAVDHLLSNDQFHEVVVKTLKRFWSTNPVTFSELRTRR
jgi:beta-xylosidase